MILNRLYYILAEAGLWRINMTSNIIIWLHDPIIKFLRCCYVYFVNLFESVVQVSCQVYFWLRSSRRSESINYKKKNCLYFHQYLKLNRVNNRGAWKTLLKLLRWSVLQTVFKGPSYMFDRFLNTFLNNAEFGMNMTNVYLVKSKKDSRA